LPGNLDSEIRAHQFAQSAAGTLLLLSNCRQVITPLIDDIGGGKHVPWAKFSADFTTFAKFFIYFNHFFFTDIYERNTWKEFNLCEFSLYRN
jgi:hypothetical protein